jgi:cysteine synthase A
MNRMYKVGRLSSEISWRISKLLKFVGNTRMFCEEISGVNVCIKLEYENPTGSHKDRIAVYMIKGLKEERELRPEDCVAELSSGNTATSVAWASSFIGIKSLLLIKSYVSSLKRELIKLYGGDIVVVPEDVSINDAKRIAEEKGCIFLNQYENEYNFLAHYETTAKEILDQTNKNLTHFIMGIGTGGTISGVGKRLKEELANVKVIGVIPEGSVLSKRTKERFEVIEGLVTHRVPKLYERHKEVIDKIVEVSFPEALEAIKEIYKKFSIVPGPSTGASFAALLKLMKNKEIDKGDRVVIIAADLLTRYPDILGKLKMA